MTAFFHEQEHAANHNPALDQMIDASPAAYEEDFKKINERCKRPQVEQESAPITAGLTPP